MMRAATSVEPPGGKGTTRVICRDGKGCACALAAIVASASAIMNFLMRPPVVSVVPSIQPGQSLRRVREHVDGRMSFSAQDLDQIELSA